MTCGDGGTPLRRAVARLYFIVVRIELRAGSDSCTLTGPLPSQTSEAFNGLSSRLKRRPFIFKFAHFSIRIYRPSGKIKLGSTRQGEIH